MIWVLETNYNTSFYKFSIDSEDELKLLPRYGVKGQDRTATILSCCPNSKAICSDGTIYALNGETNEWVKFSRGSSGGGSGGISSDDFATEGDIDDLF